MDTGTKATVDEFAAEKIEPNVVPQQDQKLNIISIEHKKDPGHGTIKNFKTNSNDDNNLELNRQMEKVGLKVKRQRPKSKGGCKSCKSKDNDDKDHGNAQFYHFSCNAETDKNNNDEQPQEDSKEKDDKDITKVPADTTATNLGHSASLADNDPDLTTAADPTSILSDCESYLNWVINPSFMIQENLKKQIELIQYKYVFPNEKYEEDFIRKFNPLEHISNLGALCFFYIESENFAEAVEIIEKTKMFVKSAVQGGYMPTDIIESLDYIWIFLRIKASLREWQVTKRMQFFPEINVTHVPRSFKQLNPTARAGVLGLRFYFFRLQKAPFNTQLEVIRKAISLDRSNYEWHYLLHITLRNQRKEQTLNGLLLRTIPRDEEVRELDLAIKLAPNNPRCILASMQYFCDYTKMLLKEIRPIDIKLGDIKFHSIIAVKSYLQEQATKILYTLPSSVLMRTAIADIFSVALPGQHRNHTLAKEILTACLQQYPDSVKANHRMGLLYLSVEANYVKAEEHFEIAQKLDGHSYTVLTALVWIMMRKVSTRHDEIVQLIDQSLAKTSYWDKKQEGGLRYLKALALCASPITKAKLAADEFIKAYKCNEKALIFSELPSWHRRYGWPDWETNSRLTFEKIRQRVSKVDVTGIDTDKKQILEKLFLELDTATIVETKLSNKWKA